MCAACETAEIMRHIEARLNDEGADVADVQIALLRGLASLLMIELAEPEVMH